MADKTDKKQAQTKKADAAFEKRLARHSAELSWLYRELYFDDGMYEELIDSMRLFSAERKTALRRIDTLREKDPGWYRSNELLGMMLYIENFGGTLKGVEQKLDYLERANVNYIHLMPFLDTVEGRSDGGYAVADFRKVRRDLGTMKDFEHLTASCRDKGICVCMDFVMNHTSIDHEWAQKALAGDPEYMDRYFFFDTDEIPKQFEETTPQVFPTTAPGNFTYQEKCGKWVMTTFYPYQWDLNYRNPRVFNEMMYNFLFLANKGVDVIRIDAVPYIWKEIGTPSRNLRRVHTVVRMMRLIGEIVCPGVLLLGEVVMEPAKVVPYFGSVEKPECHMLYNVTTMATTWHTVATRDAGLLKKQLDILAGLPRDYLFLNYLRCHDDIGWGLDYAELEKQGMREVPHKMYLNDYFRGYTGDSVSRGELYNFDPVTKDGRFCGTTASMCGIEKAVLEKDRAALDRAIRFDLTLHAYMFMQSGIPVLYSGDEIGQLNDYTYLEDPYKKEDSRYIHRGRMRWDLAENIDEEGTVENRVFGGLNRLEKIRKAEKAFRADADFFTLETYDKAVICIGRYLEGEKLLGIFNFSENDRTAWIDEKNELYTDLVTGDILEAKGVNIEAYGFKWLKRR
ncbi:MAG: alpha-amylase family protein [Clostridia bacterium]|nr:alpha-amylase family protein [Clostridia bacterium]